MTSASKRFAQKVIAVVVIVTMLYGAGVAPLAIMFVTGVVLVVFLVSRRAQNREVERIFDFYLSAEAILRDEDRRWFGFEIAEVIEAGELVLEGISDPPPLHLFTLGALHHKLGNYASSVDYLSHVIENEHNDEGNRAVASPQLRRYVTLLRKIEAEPSLAPQMLGAIRSLERMRRRQALTLLAEGRKSLKTESNTDKLGTAKSMPTTLSEVGDAPQNVPVSIPRPIRDVLKDIYQDDQTSYN